MNGWMWRRYVDSPWASSFGDCDAGVFNSSGLSHSSEETAKILSQMWRKQAVAENSAASGFWTKVIWVWTQAPLLLIVQPGTGHFELMKWKEVNAYEQIYCEMEMRWRV